MVRRITLFACFAVAALNCSVGSAQQQEAGPVTRRLGGLSERLDQFRQDLLGKKEAGKDGEPSVEADQRFSVSRKLTRRPKSKPQPVELPAPPTTVEMPTEGELPSEPQLEGPQLVEPAPAYSSHSGPNRLEPQAARRAQGTAPSSTVIEPVDSPQRAVESTTATPARRPIIVRPPKIGIRRGDPQADSRDAANTGPAARTASQPLPRVEVEPVESTGGEMPSPVHTEPVARPTSKGTRLPVVAGKSPGSHSVKPSAGETPATEPSTASAASKAGASEEAPVSQPTLAAPTQDEHTTLASKLADSSAGEEVHDHETTEADSKPAAEASSGGLLFTSASPVLSVEATGPRKVLIGKEAAFVVKIRNSGAAANNVVVSIKIPDNVEVQGTQATAGTAQPSDSGDRREAMQWKIDRLDGSSSETLHLTLVPRKSTPLDLAIQWTFTPEASQTMVEVQEPKLAMTISGPDEVLYGQSKIYKLVVSNPGNGDSENVVVGLLPIGRSTQAAPNHRLGTLRAGESKTIDIELAARQAGSVTIKAQAFADGGLRAEATEQVMVRRASLRVDVAAPKVKYAATNGTYRVKVVNAGDATAENVQVMSMLPPDTKFVSASGGGRMDAQLGKVTWVIGSLQAGGERTFDLECALLSPGENRTQFVAVADGDLSAAATSITHVEALADLKIEVRDPQGPIAVGNDAVYEVQIRNRGTKAAEHVDVLVFFSEGIEATHVDGPAHDIATGQVIFKPITTIGPGESVNIRVHAQADRPGNHIFRAELISHAPSTKLAAEEATHFYGEERVARNEPTPAAPRGEADEAGEPVTGE